MPPGRRARPAPARWPGASPRERATSGSWARSRGEDAEGGPAPGDLLRRVGPTALHLRALPYAAQAHRHALSGGHAGAEPACLPPCLAHDGATVEPAVRRAERGGRVDT